MADQQWKPGWRDRPPYHGRKRYSDFREGDAVRKGDEEESGLKRRRVEDSEVPPATLRVLVRNNDAGGIIGKGGDNIKRLRKQYDCQVLLPDSPGSPERVMTTMGTIESCCAVLRDVLPKIGEGMHRGEPNFVTEVQVLIPQPFMGTIIGTGGTKIKELRSQTKAAIKIFSDPMPNSNERSISLQGTSDQITHCVQYFLEEISKKEPREPIFLYEAGNAFPPYSPVGPSGGFHHNGRGMPRGPPGFRGDRPWMPPQRGHPHYGPRGRGGGRGGHRAPMSGPASNMPPVDPWGGQPSVQGPFSPAVHPVAASAPRDAPAPLQPFPVRPPMQATAPPPQNTPYSSPATVGYGLPPSNQPPHPFPPSHNTARPMGSGPGPMGSVPGPMGSVPGPLGSVPGPMGSGPGPMGSVPGPLGSVPGPVPGPMGSVPGPMGSGPMGSVPGQSGSAPQTTANIQQGQSSYSAVSTQPRQSQQVTIPLEYTDSIVGPGGTGLQQIRGQSGCEVTIEDPKPGSSERIITIYGTLGAIQFAQQLMQNSVRQHHNV